MGFIDDYLKNKRTKMDLSGILKVIGQIGLGLIVSVTMYYHPDITIKENMQMRQVVNRNNVAQNFVLQTQVNHFTVPFMKNNEYPRL